LAVFGQIINEKMSKEQGIEKRETNTAPAGRGRAGKKLLGLPGGGNQTKTVTRMQSNKKAPV
jgi:hypothetical protein